MPEVRIHGHDVGTLKAGELVNLTKEEAERLVKDGLASYTNPTELQPPAAPAEESEKESEEDGEFDPDSNEYTPGEDDAGESSTEGEQGQPAPEEKSAEDAGDAA